MELLNLESFIVFMTHATNVYFFIKKIKIDLGKIILIILHFKKII